MNVFFFQFSFCFKTCIDHVLVSPGLANANAWVIDAEIADHLPIAICHKLKKGKNPGNNPISKNTMINYKKLDHLMSNINLEDIEKYSANVAFNKLQQVVTSNVKQSQYIASRKQTPRNPWIKQSTIQLGLTVDRLRRKYIRSPTIENETAYKTNKKLHQKTIRQNKVAYYKEQLRLAGQNQSKVWQIINQVTGRCKNSDTTKNVKLRTKNNEILSDDFSIANEFNQYYTNIAYDLAKSIEKPEKTSNYYVNQVQQPVEKFK